jgi:hypothetical protein
LSLLPESAQSNAIITRFIFAAQQRGSPDQRSGDLEVSGTHRVVPRANAPDLLLAWGNVDVVQQEPSVRLPLISGVPLGDILSDMVCSHGTLSSHSLRLLIMVSSVFVESAHVVSSPGKLKF